jgi:SAM-dependent methyltransferase
MGDAYVRWMYRVRGKAFARAAKPIVRPGLRVLDIGSGTGFYITQWRRLGVASVDGSDLTDVAVTRLRRLFPGRTFERFELGAREVPLTGPYDVISAMDVLFHIVDDARYVAALEEIRGLLKPGGLVLFSENFADGVPDDQRMHHLTRSGSWIEEALVRAGFAQASRRPTFVLMNKPVASNSRLAKGWWRTVTRIVTRTRRGGALLGATLYPLEILLTRFLGTGPSTHIVVARRLPAS